MIDSANPYQAPQAYDGRHGFRFTHEGWFAFGLYSCFAAGMWLYAKLYLAMCIELGTTKYIDEAAAHFVFGCLSCSLGCVVLWSHRREGVT